MIKSKIYLVYSNDFTRRAPGEIGRILSEELGKDFDVVCLDWASTQKITPTDGDILIGHPHPAVGTVLHNSWHENWRAKILMFPFNPDPFQNSFAWKLMIDADAFIAISGSLWLENIKQSRFSSWECKFKRVDLGIHMQDYPLIKTSCIPDKNYGVLYLGRTEYPKNRKALNFVGRHLESSKRYWVGSGRGPAGFTSLGFIPSNSRKMKEVVEQSDFLLLLSKYDAQPVTVLEAMCWGLIPVLSKNSGFKPDELEAVFLEEDDIGDVQAKIESFMELNNSSIQDLRSRNRARVREKYDWSFFILEVRKVIEEVLDPTFQKEIIHYRFRERILFRSASFVSPIRFRRAFWKTRLKSSFTYWLSLQDKHK